MEDPGFRLNLEGFEDEIFIASDLGYTAHLSAYSPNRKEEVALLFRGDDEIASLIWSHAKAGRQTDGAISTPGSTRIQRADVYWKDILTIRCILLEWFATYGDSKPND